MISRTKFRKDIEILGQSNMFTRMLVKSKIDEFLNSRNVWYNKIEYVTGNSLKQIRSDCDFVANTLLFKFGETLGIEPQTMSLRIFRKIRENKPRKSIRKSGKNRRSM